MNCKVYLASNDTAEWSRHTHLKGNEKTQSWLVLSNVPKYDDDVDFDAM
jgi:hypothetical protein